MRRLRGDNLQNLDSLTDTLTNVVGFMIVATLVTQISVGDAVTRSAPVVDGAPIVVTPEVIAEAQQLQERLEKALATLQERWGKLEPNLNERQVELEGLRAALASLEKEAARPGTLGRQRPELEAQLATLKTKLADLQKQVDEALRREAELQQQLAKAPPLPKDLGPKTVRIPIVRDAPAGMKTTFWVCRRGRIVPFNVDTLADKFQTTVRTVLHIPQAQKQITLSNNDAQQITTYFTNNDVGDAYFRLKLENLGFLLLLTFEPRRDDMGETLEQIRDAKSAFQKQVKTMNTAQFTGRFLVWADSFDIYLEARGIAENAHMRNNKTRFLAGWAPYDVNEQIREALGAGGGGGGPKVD